MLGGTLLIKTRKDQSLMQIMSVRVSGTLVKTVTVFRQGHPSTV